MGDHINNQVASSSPPRFIFDSSQFVIPNSNDSGPQAMGSISKEWTNEKHSSYLDSMEASFVRRLHSHGYHSMDMLGQNSRLANLQDCNMSLPSNANDLKHSNQFKVLQGGCWKKINFEPNHPKKNTDECRVLLENQWVRHFRYADKHQKLAPPILQGNHTQDSEFIKSGGQKLEICAAVDLNKTASYGAIVSSKKLHVSDSHQPNKDYVSRGKELEYTSNLKYLVNLDVSSNSLEGQIPEELTYLLALKGFNFSNNQLTGEIPKTIGKLQQLESLDLSQNQLNGIIPASISQLDFLSHLNFSYNNLSGEIPSGVQLQTFDASSYEGAIPVTVTSGEVFTLSSHLFKISNANYIYISTRWMD